MKSILTLLFFFISQSLLAQTNPVLTEIVQRLDSVIHYKEQKKSSYMEWANIWERLKNQHERLDSYSNEFSELVRNGLATEDRQKWIERSLAYGYNTAGVELLSAQKTTVQLSHLLLASNGRINNENFELIKNLIKKEGKSKWVKGIIPKIYRLSNFSDSLSKENRDWIYKLASETFKEVEKKAKKDELTFRLANYLTRINLHKKVKLDAEMAESYWKLNKANTPAIQYKLESAAQNENWDSGLKVIESLPK